MAFSLQDELRATFDLATRRHEAKILKTSQDWIAFEALTSDHGRARSEAAARYRAEYDTRVEQAMSDILNEKAVPTLDIWTPFGSDIFKKDALLRQAHRRVQQDHAWMMAGIDEAETQAIETLLSDTATARVMDGRSQQDFARAAERRSSGERRTGSTRKITISRE